MLSRNSEILNGQPCFAGTRIPLSAVTSFARKGYTAEQIRSEYPTLSLEEIRWGMRFVENAPGDNQGPQGMADWHEWTHEELTDKIERLQAAVSGIAPWLSASLSPKPDGLGVDAGPEYRAACDAVFAVDAEKSGEV